MEQKNHKWFFTIIKNLHTLPPFFKASITHYLGCLEEYVHFTERGFYRQREYGDTTKKRKQF